MISDTALPACGVAAGMVVPDWARAGGALSADDAVALQNALRTQVRREALDVDGVRLVAGADISFDRGAERVFAGVVVLRMPELTVVERAGVESAATFPYIPGLLSFREIPPLLEAWQKLTVRPDALIADGQGYAHPRRFGIACHLGLTLDVPTAGCAKSLLVGRYDAAALGEEQGATAELTHRRERVGMAVRTRAGVSPVFVSEGYRCDLPSAVGLVLRCTRKTRVPETTRLAHAFVNELRRAAGAEDQAAAR